LVKNNLAICWGTISDALLNGACGAQSIRTAPAEGNFEKSPSRSKFLHNQIFSSFFGEILKIELAGTFRPRLPRMVGSISLAFFHIFVPNFSPALPCPIFPAIESPSTGLRILGYSQHLLVDPFHLQGEHSNQPST
jgi:hypothetical protein